MKLDRGRIGSKELTGIVVIAGVVVVLLLITFWGSKPELAMPPATDAADEAAREEVNQIFDQELAAAIADAAANEEARLAELNATHEALNWLSNSPAALPDDLPPEAVTAPAYHSVVSRQSPGGVATRTPDAALPPGWATTRDGQMVNVQAMIDSVRAEGSIPGNAE